MGDHDAFGVPGRTRCVLQQRKVGGIGQAAAPRHLRRPAIGADDESRQPSERGVALQLGGDALLRARIGEDHRRVAVPAYRRQRAGEAPRAGREARDGDQARVEAGEQRRDIAEPGLQHDHDRGARPRPLQQRRGQRSRAAVERPICHGLFERLAVAQEGIGGVFALVMRAVAENLDDRTGAALDVAAHRSLACAIDEVTTTMSEAASCITSVWSQRSFKTYLTRRIEASRGVSVPRQGGGTAAGRASTQSLLALASRWFRPAWPLAGQGKSVFQRHRSGEGGAALAIDPRYRGAAWLVSTTRSC